MQSASSHVENARRQMFAEFCALLENDDIDYVVLSGRDVLKHDIQSDVDFMVLPKDLPRLSRVLARPNAISGALLVQSIQHEIGAWYFAFAKQIGPRIAYLHPDASGDYRRFGRLWLRAADVLASKERAQDGFWVPSPRMEFAYYLIKRAEKRAVDARQMERLRALYLEDTLGVREICDRMLGAKLSRMFVEALVKNDLDWMPRALSQVRSALGRSRTRESWSEALGIMRLESRRICTRLLRPTGLVLALLGPDGSGKSTVLEEMQRSLAPAFRGVRTFHLRPRLEGKGEPGAGGSPHTLRARGHIVSVLKLVMFLFDYWAGWVFRVWPGKCRSLLAIFDRYFHDMLVDSKRYRLPEMSRLVSLFATRVPQPDLWLVMTANPDVLLTRKDELTEESASHLVEHYERLHITLEHSVLVDAGQPLDSVLRDVHGAVLNFMNARVIDGLKRDGTLA